MALLNPYLNFNGNAREAMEFYQSVFGGQLDVSTFGDFAMPGVGQDEADKVMHSQLTTTSGFTIMASDVPSVMPTPPTVSNISVSLSGEEADELQGYFAALADGGEVGMPLSAAPWGDSFGQLTDRYGVGWLVNIAGAGSGSAAVDG